LVWPTGERELGQAIVLWLPLGLLSAACGEALRYWLVRRNAFQSIAFTTLISSAAINGLKLTFGGIHPTGTTLIAITVLGAALNTLLMLRTAYQDLRSHLGEILQVNIRENINLLKRYRDYPLYRAPQNIIGAASQGFPVILLTINFGAASAGYYSVGAVLLGAPSALLGTAVRDVFYPHVAAAGRDGHNIHHLIRKATLAIAATCIWPFLLVVAFGPILFEPLLGSEWARAGEYARWISIFFFFRLLVRPAVAAVPILGLESGLLAYEVITTAAKFISMALAIVMFRNDILAIGVFSVASAASYAALLVWIMSRSRKNDVQASPDDDAG
jgi:O-antigen/teichoic acid export membrane protein